MDTDKTWFQKTLDELHSSFVIRYFLRPSCR